MINIALTDKAGITYISCVDFLLEERRLRMFENRVLRRIAGPKREEVRGE
jgi:hypothetical protein